MFASDEDGRRLTPSPGGEERDSLSCRRTASSAEAGCGAALGQIAVDRGPRHLVALEAQELDGPSLNLSAAVRPGSRVLEDGEEAAVGQLLDLHDLELRWPERLAPALGEAQVGVVPAMDLFLAGNVRAR